MMSDWTRMAPSPRPYTKREMRTQEHKPFMVWDGEGVTHAGASEMSYVLFGCQGDGESPIYIYGRDLRTHQLLSFIYETASENRDFIHVSFGFSFDVDQITRDIPNDELRKLIKEGEISWDGWTIGYIPRKFFRLKANYRGAKEVIIYDCLSFFGTNLIGAAEQYVPGHPLLEQVAKGKLQRGVFTYAELHTVIIPYWKVENELFTETMIALRTALLGAGIKLTSWHGPGAVANALIKSNRIATHVQDSRNEMPLAVTEAAQFGFFGGRFECNIIGHITGPIYSYDLRSAYPAALAQQPGLSGGKWSHEFRPSSISEWGIYKYRISSQANAASTMGLGPLPNRAPNGTVSFALSGMGWSYGHEIIAAQLTGFDLEIIEGWTYQGTTFPFIFVKEMYVKRAQYKANGNPAQLGLKLGMNSVYGKLAQTVGWDEDTKLPPKYHHSWYAGQTTSWCRARIQIAMAQQPSAIIACETDGIYSLSPLDLRIGTHLGEWEASVYDEMYYVQSGFYFARKGDEWKVAKVRGLSTGNVGLDIIRDSCETLSPIVSSVHRYGALTGYIGHAKAHTWFDQERVAIWGGDGKRTHDQTFCPRCNGTSRDSYHRTVMTRPLCGNSTPRTLPWKDNPELDESVY